MFTNNDINFEALKRKAYNGRWATLDDGIIPLTAADPDFRTAPEIEQGIIEYIKDGYLSYGPFSGLPEFKKSVADHFNTEKHGSFTPENVLAVNSAAQGMYLVASYVLKPEDEAIILDPVDFLFKKSVEAAGGKVKLCPVNTTTGVIDFEKLSTLITPKTKLISICNPHNPLGKVYSKETLKKISEIASAHDLWVMSDEIWSDIIYDNKEFYTYSSVSEEAKRKSFTVYGFSKSFGIAGLRIGAVLCNDQEILEDFTEKSNFNSTIEGVSTLSQIAGSVALERAKPWYKEFLAHIQHNRDFAYNIINQSEIFTADLPEATFVVFPKIKNGMTSEEFAKHALQQGKVAIVPGSERWFGKGAEGHVRICFSTSQEILEEGLHRIISSF
ncbi:pyridoxal phosphate-dependent aminotransferase [Chryseobacterium indologenes]|uniref:pyridoxal phosphate-dependent aminotransferase n=1 Tax=Chryseobacterium indologenes TaxID=253 RepID=UPI0003E08213|nr:pyridoxal phosphate-dependent aminotransferase [Chryseobacterium indologenes]QPQ53059.1 pyridoxal phosphate-dependent aminotransferase [Chryseobacterium indologenes]GAE66206.1 putative aspartate aminotransferase [Chryseobacterium indologenes NBRC 14944]SFK26692.1 aminotransferase/cystathione beta-lyase [Chryseobacterium indologenes]SUX51843.1 Aspartate aminotransferase [Chryseobacterium indologenes]